MELEVVILTKSSKFQGYCVAGIDVHSGQWVRLTSSDEHSHGALINRDMLYRDGSLCKTLDVVKIPIIGRNPTEYQPENVLIDREQYWTKTGTHTIAEVLRVHPAERHIMLLGNQYPYITEARIGTVGHSLVLAMVSNLIITQPQKTKASFVYGQYTYDKMSVTDSDYYGVADNTRVGRAILVVSLPDSPYPEDRYYKFVAKIYSL